MAGSVTPKIIDVNLRRLVARPTSTIRTVITIIRLYVDISALDGEEYTPGQFIGPTRSDHPGSGYKVIANDLLTLRWRNLEKKAFRFRQPAIAERCRHQFGS